MNVNLIHRKLDRHEDVDPWVQRFHKLDADKSGTLNATVRRRVHAQVMCAYVIMILVLFLYYMLQCNDFMTQSSPTLITMVGN
jgi:hypothetical protein